MIEPIVYATVGICLLLVVMLLKSQVRNLYNALLILWLLVTMFELLITNGIYQGSTDRYFYYKSIVALLHVALLFAYLKALVDEKWRWGLLWHSLPFALFAVTGFLVDQRMLIVEYRISLAILAIVGLYLVMSIRLTLRSSSPRLRFLRTVLIIYCCVWVLLVAANTLFMEYRMSLLWSGMLSFVVLVWVFVINSLRLEILQDIKVKMKYMKSGMTIGKARSLKRQLEEVLETEKPYLNANLKISDLSQRMGVAENYISQVVNAEFEMSFNDFINGYRVKAFKAMTADGDKNHLTLFGIAEECGFQSKSTFNAAFKKATGMTPSEYKAKLATDPTRSVA